MINCAFLISCCDLLEETNCSGWTQHAKHIWREWCHLCKSTVPRPFLEPVWPSTRAVFMTLGSLTPIFPMILTELTLGKWYNHIQMFNYSYLYLCPLARFAFNYKELSYFNPEHCIHSGWSSWIPAWWSASTSQKPEVWKGILDDELIWQPQYSSLDWFSLVWPIYSIVFPWRVNSLREVNYSTSPLILWRGGSSISTT